MALLPEAGVWSCADDVAAYARACLNALSLCAWSFGWDRARRRLGCCWCARRRITLSRYFVEAYRASRPELVRRTLLHELAHALAWTHHRSHGHDAAWRRYCVALGIPGERATCREADFAFLGEGEHPRYALVHELTGEVFAFYSRRPRRRPERLRFCYIPGRKEETLGRLVVEPWNGTRAAGKGKRA